jgi:hypothetical protein
MYRKLARSSIILAIGTALVFACSSPDPWSIDPATRPQNGGDGGAGSSSSSAGGGGGSTQNGIPCSVDAILKKKCQTCHTTDPKAGASTPLVTWDDLHATWGAKKLYELVKERIHSQSAPMPPASRLPADELAAIDEWVANGAPKADATCMGDVPTGEPQPIKCDAPGKTRIIKAPTKFKMTKGGPTDIYMCFGVDVPSDTKKHIVAFAPKVDNLKIAHHILVFQAPESFSQTPVPCEPTAASSWKMITGWAPGGGNFELPPEAGMPIQAGTTHWVVQMHYNNGQGLADQEDNTGYELCETEQLRPNDAGVLAFGSIEFTIPANTQRFDWTCDYKLDERYAGRKFFGANGHMHKLGTAIKTVRLPGGTGAPQLVFGQEPFSFEAQEKFKIEPHHEVRPGDVMRTTCSWTNPEARQVKWGEGTADEMCFNFLTYYPEIPERLLKIPLVDFEIPLQTWVTPSAPIPLTGPKCRAE